MKKSLILSCSVRRPADEVYERFWRPDAFPLWAEGLSASGLEKDGADWTAQGPQGRIRIRFTDYNAHRVMDHWVDIGAESPIYVPLRIVANDDGCEIVFILYRQPHMTDEEFAADAAAVRSDLARLKALAES